MILETININKNKVMTAVRNMSHKLGLSRNLDTKERSRYQIDDLEQDSHLTDSSFYKYLRKITFIAGTYYKDTGKRTYDDSEIIFIRLILPDNWLNRMHNELVRTIFDYLVNSMLFDYYSIVDPKESLLYKSFSDDLEFKIKDICEMRNQRCKYHNNKLIQNIVDDYIPFVDIVQETGDSTTSVMSQKAVTDALKDIEIVVDSELSVTSDNPVQNKVITKTLNKKIEASVSDEKILLDNEL